MSDIKLLDCTLRDGGYLNDWKFDKDNIVNVFERLVSANIDIIEVGFIDERRDYDPDRTIYPDTGAIRESLGALDKGNSIIVGMIDYGTCGIDKIEPCSESFLDGIRVIFKKHKMHEAIEFCSQIKALGYRVFAQAVSITSYNDEEFKELIGLVNELNPYAFSLVDTYGLLHRSGLRHYFDFAIANLNREIGIGYHAHNNFQLAYANCVELLQNPPKDRMMIVDGTLYGMGKSAGNTPIELLAMYYNENIDKRYHNSQLLEAIEVTILEIRKTLSWGYGFKFFLSASHDCHPNYVDFLMDKKKLSIKSIGEILDRLEGEKKLLYDADYIAELYLEYQKNDCDDSKDMKSLVDMLKGQDVLVMGPGQNIYKQRDKVEGYIKRNNPVTIAINFIPDDYRINYIFMSNAKRYVQLSSKLLEEKNSSRLIATSNITKTNGEFDYTLNYSNLLDEEALMPDNPMLMLLRILKICGVKKVALAGFDGYSETSVPNYVNPNMEYSMSTELAQSINNDVITGINKLKLPFELEYVTDSKYEG